MINPKRTISENIQNAEHFFRRIQKENLENGRPTQERPAPVRTISELNKATQSQHAGHSYTDCK